MSTQEKVTVVLDIQGEVGNLQSALNKVQSAFNKLNTNNTVGKEFAEDLQDAQKALERLKSVSKKDKITLVDQKEVEKAFRTFESAYKRLVKTSESKDFLNLDTKRMTGARQGIDSLTQALEQYKKVQKEVKTAAEATNRVEKQQKKADLDQVKVKEEALYKQLKEREKYNANGAKKLAETTDNKEYQKLYADRIRLQQEYNQKKIRLTEEEVAQNDKVVEAFKKVQSVAQEVGKSFPELGEELKNASTPEAIEQIVAKLREIGTTDANRIMNLITSSLGDIGQAANDASPKIDEARNSLENLKATGKDIDQLRNRLMYFFGIGNAVQLFKRSIRSAYETLKDLDAVMTETAVVTQFDIGQMWEQLPIYVQRANELGLTIHDVYESMTLFYQQGLNTTEATELSTQALKMARIAGLDAATAVDRVTNALRGFNMELNEASATNIADVYSKLAAITASNVDEISTAMTKVASLANNANMSFENTAAFLAQIIESTRESAETAGTALKTVIARFSEVKKLYSEGELLGTDEEGEGIDVNRISTALRTAGLNLNEYLTGMKGLDQIFIDLAAKWDSLSIVQQRYIATQAAGSRQQSRFIALMSDYQRTLQLTEAAQNAAGASEEQYQKTLDSLESKLNQLKNAWNEFTMNILNSGFLKAIIDFVRTLLNGINAITGKLPPMLKSFANLGVIFGGLKLGRNLLFGKNGLVSTITKATQGKEIQSIGSRIFDRIFLGFKQQSGKVSSRMGSEIFDKINQAAITKANEFKKIQAEYSTAFANGTLGMQQYNKVVRESTVAEAAYQAVLAETGVTQEAYDVLVGLGLTNKEKALVLTGLNTGAITLEDLANKDLTKTELLEMLAAKGVHGAKLMLLKDRVENILLLIAEKLGIYDKTAADAAETAGIHAKNTAMLASLGIIGAIIAAIALLIVVIVQVTKQLKDQTPEARLKRTQDELEKLNDTIKETKDNTDGLKSAVDTFEELQDKVNHTVKGTQAWKEALIEANQQIIELAEKYPKLADKITVGANGQLTFDTQVLDDFYQSQVDQLNTLNNIYLVTQGIENVLKGETTRGAVLDTVNQSEYSNKEELQSAVDQIALAITNGDFDFDTMIQEGYNFETGEYETFTEEGKKALAALEVGEDTAWQVYMLFHDKFEELYNYGLELQNTTNDFQKIIDTVFAGSEDLATTDIAKTFSSFVDVNQLLEEEKQRLSMSPQALGQALSRANIIRDDSGNYYINKVDKENKIDSKDALDMAARAVLPEKIESVANDFLKLYNEENLQQRQFLDRFLSGRLTTEELTLDLGTLFENNGITDMGAFLQEVGFSEEDFKKSISNTQQLREFYNRDFINYGINPEYMENISNEAMAFLLNGFKQSFADSPGIAQMIYGHIVDAMENVPEDKQDDFIKAIGNLPFANLDSVLALQDTLKSFEIDGDFTSLINNISRLAQSTTEASTNLTGLYEIIEKIGNGETVFSEEDYKELLGFGANENDFMQDLEGNYIYIGNDLGKLLADTTANAYAVQLQSYRNAIEKDDMATAGQNLANMEALRQQQLTSGNYQQIQQAIGGATDNELLATALKYPELTDDVSKYRTEIEKLTQAEKNATEEEKEKIALQKETQKTLLRNAVLGQAQQKQFNNLTSVINDNRDAFLSANKSSQGYRDSLGKVTQAAQVFFGSNLTSEFVEDHREDFAAMADGDVQALERIRDFIKDELTESFNAPNSAFIDAQDQASELLNYLAQLDGSDFTVDGHLNDTEIVAGINRLIQQLIAAGVAADDVRALVESMGYTIDWEVSYKNIPIKGNVTDEDMWTLMPGQHRPTPVGKVIQVPTPSMVVRSIGDNAGKDWTPPLGGGGSGGSGGGGGGSEKNDIWENPYDELYNLTEKVNEALRDREKLERDYDRILNNRKATSQQLIDNSLAEVANLRREIDLQRQLLSGRRKQLAALGSETHTDSEGNLRSFNSWGVTKYASYNEKTGLIEIDWAGIDAITDTELGEAVEAYVSRVEELAGQIEDIYDSIEDMSDKIDEIRERNKENYLEFEQRVYDAIVQREQRTIDEYQAISDSIAESNSQIIDSMRESIDLERQIRDNTKTEEDLADKETRLAYLRRDTSGANQTEILKLEKELEEGRQSYQDNLIDQAIDKLDQQNQQAAEQREKQIELMQAQLDWQAEHGEFWDETYELINTAFTKKGSLNMNSDLVNLLKETEAFKGMSKYGQEDWINDMVQAWKEAQEGLYNWENPATQPEYYSQQPKTAAGAQGAQPKTGSGGKSASGSDANGEGGKGLIASLGDTLSKSDTKKLQEGLLQLKSKGLISFGGLTADGDYGWYTEQAVKALQRKLNELTNAGLVIDGLWGKYTRSAFQKSSLKAYKTGGLADFTGPAWLDGSLTKPEMVLNSQDTHNFLSLVDMLRNLAASGQALNDMSFGDYLFNITVNAELNNDYDVDRLVDRLKDRISSEASYRNINTMSRFR